MIIITVTTMTVAMQLELILKYFKTAFKDFKLFTGLGLHHITTSMGGRVGGLSETGNKVISASIEIGVELRLSLAMFVYF